MKLLIATDAWAPQINGVVRTLEVLVRELEGLGHQVLVASPEGHFSLPLPTYPEIRLAVLPRRRLARLMDAFRPDAVHIATEGPIGWAARALCRKRGLAFTTSYHTRFPDYVHVRFPLVPESAVYRVLRRFHAPAHAVMVATGRLERELAAHGFSNTRLWSRGVDVDHFRPLPGAALPYPRPIWLSVGRVAVEKNIEAFLSLDLPGSKVVVGDGPARARLERAFPNTHFLGALTGEALVRAYSAADVFVFPSRTDTFGLVVLEALACGTPVAAYPVQGPQDVVGDAPVAALDEDLGAACLRALEIRREEARAFATTRSWAACTRQFLAALPAP